MASDQTPHPKPSKKTVISESCELIGDLYDFLVTQIRTMKKE